MIPAGIRDTHIKKSAAIIDKEGVPWSRKSVHYDLILNGKSYPPKYVVSLAAKFVNGVEFPPGKFNAVEAKNYFLARGYVLVDRRTDKIERVASEDDESQFPEGKAGYRIHRQLERDSKLSKSAKIRRLEETGTLCCDVCNFDFAKTYGELGFGFIEAHHTLPVSELKGRRKTKISELALLCSNCHRMIHRGRSPLSIKELKKAIYKK